MMIPKPIVYKVSTVYAPYLDFLKITIKQIWNIRGKEKKKLLYSIEYWNDKKDDGQSSTSWQRG